MEISETLTVLGIDPGNVQSGIAVWETGSETSPKYDIVENVELRDDVLPSVIGDFEVSMVALELVRSYGMTVGATVLDTCIWTGILEGTMLRDWGEDLYIVRIPRKDVKMHLCRNNRAKDSNIIQAVCDRFGMDKRGVKGTKKNQGPLYGIKADMWQALALAITLGDNVVDGKYVEDSANIKMKGTI